MEISFISLIKNEIVEDHQCDHDYKILDTKTSIDEKQKILGLDEAIDILRSNSASCLHLRYDLPRYMQPEREET